MGESNPVSKVLTGANLCPCCGANEGRPCLVAARDYITEKMFIVNRCSSCETSYTWPQPKDMSKYYPQRYRRYAKPVRAALQALYGQCVQKWHRRQGGPGRVLEIGCGGGWMLKAFSDIGWTVMGIERSVQEVQQARSRFGLPVFVGDLSAFRQGARFDVIIMFHVIEHISDPTAVLRHCARLLKPQGVLIVAVPNLASWQARIFGSRWFHLDVPRHLIHFTPRSLTAVLAQSGFDVRDFQFASAHDLYGWVQSALNGMGFRQNLLTDLLMGRHRSIGNIFVGLIMAAIGAILLLPGLVLSVISWECRAGAVMEVQAVRRI